MPCQSPSASAAALVSGAFEGCTSSARSGATIRCTARSASCSAPKPMAAPWVPVAVAPARVWPSLAPEVCSERSRMTSRSLSRRIFIEPDTSMGVRPRAASAAAYAGLSQLWGVASSTSWAASDTASRSGTPMRDSDQREPSGRSGWFVVKAWPTTSLSTEPTRRKRASASPVEAMGR